MSLVALACSGSTTGEPQRDPTALIQDACDRIVACGPLGMQQCTDQAAQDRADAAAKGCASKFDAMLECFAALADCPQTSPQPCSAEHTALDSCMYPTSGDECSQGYGGAPPGASPGYQVCDISCPSWGVKCSTDGSAPLVCTCTAGPKAGATFDPSPSTCQNFSIDLGAQHCQG